MWTRCPYTHCCQWIIRISLSCPKVMSSVLFIVLGYLRIYTGLAEMTHDFFPSGLTAGDKERFPRAAKLTLVLGNCIWPLLSNVRHFIPWCGRSPHSFFQPNACSFSVANLQWGFHNRRQEYSNNPCKAWHKCHNFADCKNRREQRELFLSLATVTLVRSQKSILQPLLFSCVFSIEVICETHLS